MDWLKLIIFSGTSSAAPQQLSPGCKEPEIEERRSSREEPGQERHHSRQLVPPAEPG